ncbi:hypothetical protein ACIQUV_05050 [Streptomyces globosus]|uniref:hypothetical protein n=1 Tax=Streptomyces globosus TaxID=68209 RepID=UPI003826136C
MLFLHAEHREDERFDGEGAAGPAAGRFQGAQVQTPRRVVPFGVEGDPGGDLEQVGVRGSVRPVLGRRAGAEAAQGLQCRSGGPAGAFGYVEVDQPAGEGRRLGCGPFRRVPV